MRPSYIVSVSYTHLDVYKRQMLYDAVRRLGSREKRIVHLRYGLHGGSEHTQKEVADMMGISQSYISRLEKRIVKQLQSEMLKMA